MNCAFDVVSKTYWRTVGLRKYLSERGGPWTFVHIFIHTYISLLLKIQLQLWVQTRACPQLGLPVASLAATPTHAHRTSGEVGKTGRTQICAARRPSRTFTP